MTLRPPSIAAALALGLTLWAGGCASLPANVQRTASKAFDAPEQTSLGKLVVDRRGADRARSDNGFALLDGVEAAFAARLALIDSAQRTLDLQYYAIHADASTELLLQRLKAAAQRGVRVRILLDDFNTVGKDAQVLRLAFEPNVAIRLFNPLPGSRASLLGRIVTSLKDMDRVQKRMHNKMFVADSAMGITGGRNLGDAYFGADGESNFVDLDVLAAGRVVRDMSASFDRYWNNELAYPVQTLLSAEDLEALRKPPVPQDESFRSAVVSTAAASQPATTASASASASVLPNITGTAVIDAQPAPMDLKTLRLTWAPATLLQDQPGKIGPDDDEADAGETVVDGLLNVMSQAKQEVLIVSPYFVPGAQMMAQFGALRTKGIRVRVLTNSLASNDAPAAHAGYARYRKELVAMGVELHEMRAAPQAAVRGQGGSGGGSGFGLGNAAAGSKTNTSRASLHTKAAIIDGRLSIIGSMNLDLRSQRKNSEVALLIRSRALSQEAAKRIDAMIRQAAYRVQIEGDHLVWRAPPGAGFQDATSEPEASTQLKLLVQVIGPFAPEEML